MVGAYLEYCLAGALLFPVRSFVGVRSSSFSRSLGLLGYDAAATSTSCKLPCAGSVWG